MLLKFSSFRRQIDPKKRQKTEENEEESFIQFRVCVGFYEIIVLFKNLKLSLVLAYFAPIFLFYGLEIKCRWNLKSGKLLL